MAVEYVYIFLFVVLSVAGLYGGGALARNGIRDKGRDLAFRGLSVVGGVGTVVASALLLVGSLGWLADLISGLGLIHR